MSVMGGCERKRVRFDADYRIIERGGLSH